MKKAVKNPLSDFFLNEAPPASATPVGRQHAEVMVATLKRDHVDMTLIVLQGYLLAWNEKWGSPFTKEEIGALVQVTPLRKQKAPQRPGPEHFAEPLPMGV